MTKVLWGVPSFVGVVRERPRGSFTNDPYGGGHRAIRAAVCTVLALLVLGSVVTPVVAVGPRDYDVANGHYYEQGASEGSGFVVHDDAAAPFWGELRRLGGVRALGYPISRRYECDGAVCQAFQYAVFKWSPWYEEIELLDVFDWLHLQGRDDWLEEAWGVPPWVRIEATSEKGQRKQERADGQALLEGNASLKSAYGRLGPAARKVYGVPRAYQETETVAVLRTQRAVLVQSIQAPGQVALVPAGQVFRDAGLVPSEAIEAIEAPRPRDATPPTRIIVPELAIDAEVISLDMSPDGELPTPNTARVVAWYSYGARLGEGGNAVMAGHVDLNREVGVFWRLRDAKPGQTITLSGAAGQLYDYKVEWVRSYPAASLAGLAALRPSSGATTITLVTCSGRFDLATRSYEDRQVVRAVLVPRG